MKTITRWKTLREFESTMKHNTIKLDGAKENGFGPKGLLLSGLAGCSGIDVLDVLEKMKVQFSDFSIEAEAEQTDEHPKVFKEIMLTYKIKTDKLNEAKVKKAIDLSLDKYCGVSAMLKKNSPINYTIVIK